MYKMVIKMLSAMVVVAGLSCLSAMEIAEVERLSPLCVDDFMNDISFLKEECLQKVSKESSSCHDQEEKDFPGSCAKLVFKIYQASLCEDASLRQEYITGLCTEVAELVRLCKASEVSKLRFIAVLTELIGVSNGYYDNTISRLKHLNLIYPTNKTKLAWQGEVLHYCVSFRNSYNKKFSKIVTLFGSSLLFVANPNL